MIHDEFARDNYDDARAVIGKLTAIDGSGIRIGR